jgi:hypothetical protein
MQNFVHRWRKPVAAALLAFFPLSFGWFPGSAVLADPAEGSMGTLLGIITDEDGDQVIVDAVVHILLTTTGSVLSSQPSDEMGMYVLRGITFGTYDLAVETERGFYLTPDPVVISQDVPLVISIALKEDEGAAALVKSAGFWKSPLGIAIIISGAVAAGFIAEDQFSDDEEAPESPADP